MAKAEGPDYFIEKDLNMRKIKASIYIAASIDGFIARKDGNLDWLDKASAGVPEGYDLGYQAFMSSVDILVMGRKSFEKVLSFGIWPYDGKRVVVLSRGQVEIPENLKDKRISVSNETPVKLLEKLEAGGCKHVYIDGGLTVQSFLEAGLVDEMTLTLAHVLIGTGIPLFGPLSSGDIELKLLGGEIFDFGMTQLKYRLVHPAESCT